MCGIAGIVLRHPSQPSREAVERMLAAIRHRGPDGHGVASIGACVLGNVRLAIMDLSERGAQPMSNDDGSVCITYNGETYNAIELRDDLEGRGHRFRSATDTEVVLRLYEEFGDGFISKLRGMFAFAIWDARRNRLLLARDRLGIKPLYLARIPNGLIFASEVRAFPASGLIPARLDPAAARVFLQLGHVPPPWCALSGVEMLAPGELAVWQEGDLRRSSYWQLPPSDTNSMRSSEVAAPAIQHELVAASRLHRMSDVPVALFLSGGVDSAAVAALMYAGGARDLTALTIGFAENAESAELDESEPSRRTAQQLGLRHQVLNLSAAEMAGSLDHALWAMDQPTMDGLNTYWISRAAARAGFKVALSGQGGDELFGGYASLRWFQRFAIMARNLRYLPPRAGRMIFDHSGLPMRWRKLSYLAGEDDPFVAAQLAVRVLFLDSDLTSLLIPPLAGDRRNVESAHTETRDHIGYWAAQVANCPSLEKIAVLDIRAHLQPRLLRDGDAMSMAHGLELRPLLLDHAVVERVMSLPARLRLDHKRLLLAALRGLMPEGLRSEIAARPKRTFTFPFARWLSGPWQGEIQNALDPARIRAAGIFHPQAVTRLWNQYCRSPESIGWSRIWTLFVLQRWSEVMGVRP
jgi:asparagine synthase (glutamine-hydrolysing)